MNHMRSNVVDILGIGAQKSATSWAAHVLNLNPDVWIPKNHALSGKEVMFWDRHYNKGLDWYARIMKPPDPNRKSMDVSPGYSRIGGKKIVECHKQSPGARIFLLLRNPVYRDWSSLIMEADLRDKFDVNAASFVDLMVYYDSKNVAQYSTYVETIKRWRYHYGDQLFIALYDDIVADPVTFYQKLCMHCHIDIDKRPDWREKVGVKIFKGPGHLLPAQMHEFLLKKYTPMVRQLEPLIGRDLSDWLSDDPKVK
jgi:hypothetical protein